MNKLLKYIFILSVFLFTISDASAQVRKQNFRRGTKKSASVSKLEIARDNFLSQQLSLTDAQSIKFWPIYHKYQEELKAVRILKRLNNSNAQANGTEQIDKELYYENQLLSIRKRYRDEFLKILPAEKVSELYKSEREFTDELIKQLSERSVRAGN
ncbi:hypothetical protein [Mucilaginibacter segetis]|uniref:Sensor of ECF-type sigma factor n=1 Tax=Mucilaginibacter segetis TaxID=2793071 RepID=A0A934PWX1_9SPHI|nr:hypothetical protein [Mucilaginibacter segetis]MBK0380518.1 hypothetical protein [Mucilaginibacter segetis]